MRNTSKMYELNENTINAIGTNLFNGAYSHLIVKTINDKLMILVCANVNNAKLNQKLIMDSYLYMKMAIYFKNLNDYTLATYDFINNLLYKTNINTDKSSIYDAINDLNDAIEIFDVLKMNDKIVHTIYRLNNKKRSKASIGNCLNEISNILEGAENESK